MTHRTIHDRDLFKLKTYLEEVRQMKELLKMSLKEILFDYAEF